LVGRWRSFVETGSPFSQTAETLDVVAPLSVPIKIFRRELMVELLSCGRRRQRQELFAIHVMAPEVIGQWKRSLTHPSRRWHLTALILLHAPAVMRPKE
jgi:hypothetical protein